MPSRYQTISTTKNNTGITSTSGKTMYVPTYYPNIEAHEDDTYILTGVTDRLDNIAFDFYGDATLWWVIAMANDLPGDTMYPPLGFQLRIPSNASRAIDQFEQLNSTR